MTKDELKEGLLVRIIESGQEGKITCICGNKAKVAGSCRISNELEIVSEHAKEPRLVFIGSIAAGIMATKKDFFEIGEFDIELIKEESGHIEIASDSIAVTLKNGSIISFLRSGSYKVTLEDGIAIPFHEICNGPVKAGIAQFIGRNQFYPAFAIISKWLKGGRK